MILDIVFVPLFLRYAFYSHSSNFIVRFFFFRYLQVVVVGCFRVGSGAVKVWDNALEYMSEMGFLLPYCCGGIILFVVRSLSVLREDQARSSCTWFRVIRTESLESPYWGSHVFLQSYYLSLWPETRFSDFFIQVCFRLCRNEKHFRLLDRLNGLLEQAIVWKKWERQ